MGKNTVKGATQMNGHSLKLYFLMLKDQKCSVIIWICHFSFETFSIDCKFYMLKI